MKLKNRKAFTMLELIFVIVIIGILSAIAIPKFAMTKDSATIAKAKTTVATIRNAIAMQRQKRILKGEFKPIYKLTNNAGLDKPIFDAFDGNLSNALFQYPLQSCETATSYGCWRETATGSTASPVSEYTYNMPLSGSVIFELKNNKFNCKTPTDANCKLLTR
ncbi:MAG: type II secretion system GspH family protein [Sulfurovum sp.]|nr:type II secretion system GspH family protein [Sulfurovum sp.]